MDKTNSMDSSENKLLSELDLLLHSTMPAREEAWRAGFLMALSDKDITENPFDITDEEYREWNDGWWAGFYGEENIVDNLITKSQAHFAVKALQEKYQAKQTNKFQKVQQYITEKKRSLLWGALAICMILVAYGYFIEVDVVS